ncbi:MAG TPA: hypothetical protein VE057_18105 [Archangium sp.]|nr:hypothetical protein [Archangium sp.]
MSADALFLGLLLVSVLAVSVLFALRGWRQRQARRAWLELTPRLELALTEEGDQRLLSGRHQGHSVEVLLNAGCWPDGMLKVEL